MKTMQGVIKSLKNQKTAVVEIARRWQHPIYQKFVKRSKTYSCHLENLDVKVGDEVTIVGIRPMSASKHFKVVAKVESK
ncbi:MAG: 30S ribosomal protein S17 [Patescibacteria group bacterium]